ncbi:LexA family protein [Cupriavidus taiwanensis]|uniref:LexA family protein n=1 Tax=Cupriavidus taiwanensis TaxID=164546 RepID=UPI001F1224C8|nr:S24 family peptidase [Cupriavidus taiwanensis]
MENTTSIPWDLIAEKLAKLGKKPAWLAVQLNTGTNTITNWKRRGGAPIDRAKALSEILQCSADELLSTNGKGKHHPRGEVKDQKQQNMFHGSNSAYAYNQLSVGANVEAGPDVRGKIPLVSWVQAGNWSEVSQGFTEADAEDWMPALRQMSKRAFALRVRGPSMEPKYQDGDIIYVEPEAIAEHGKRVVVQLESEPEATFKELVIEGGQKYLRALNPDWPGPKFLPINGNATIIGVVVGKWVPE